MKKVEHPDDCIRIRNALLELGYDLNLYEVERFWKYYSAQSGECNKWPGWVEIDDKLSLKSKIEAKLNILNEIPFLPRG